jgi:DNA-binding NarL/FixJ family response regulator
MRLFIADDSEILRTRLVDMLREIKGVEIVGEAKDWKEAVEAIAVLNPDVVILDIRMPEGDGILALEALKKDRRKHPKVIVFTNYPYLQYRKRCMDAGADYFFYKALEFGKLLELMKNLTQAV